MGASLAAAVTATPPAEPLDAAPLEMSTDPPVLAPLAAASVMLPPATAPSPLLMSTDPPLLLPPASSDDVPAARFREPPDPDMLDPTATDTDPAPASIESPDPMTTSPLPPIVAAPDCIVTLPLRSPDDDPTTTEPLD